MVRCDICENFALIRVHPTYAYIRHGHGYLKFNFNCSESLGNEIMASMLGIGISIEASYFGTVIDDERRRPLERHVDFDVIYFLPL